MIETESTLAITTPGAIDAMKSMGIERVVASTQYGLGFILVEAGSPDVLGGILFRDDALTHDQRREVADKINELLNP